MLEYDGRIIDWKERKVVKTINYMLGLAAILIATGMIVILWATYWTLVAEGVSRGFATDKAGIPLLETITSPEKLIATWFCGAIVTFIGTTIARKELGPDE